MKNRIHLRKDLFFVLCSLFFVAYWLFSIRPVWLGQLSGTFKAKVVPPEYIVLKDFIYDQDQFFRTFWAPKKQRFGFFSNNNPAISAESFVTDSVCQEPFCSLKEEMPERWGKDCFPNDRCYVRELSYFLNPKTAEVLSQMAVKYVVVPFDSEGEIFLAERKYNPQQREEVEEFLDTVPWLKKVTPPCFNDLNHCNKIAIYQTPSYQDHFWTERVGPSLKEEPGQGPTLAWQMVNPTKYIVRISEAAQPFKLVFSETYDELWQAKIGEKTIPSARYNLLNYTSRKVQPNSFNSFAVDQTGDFEIVVEFLGQKYAYWGLIISGLTLLILIINFIKLSKINLFR